MVAAVAAFMAALLVVAFTVAAGFRAAIMVADRSVDTMGEARDRMVDAAPTAVPCQDELFQGDRLQDHLYQDDLLARRERGRRKVEASGIPLPAGTRLNEAATARARREGPGPQAQPEDPAAQ